MYTFRSFVPPVRDEESETQRKAHAKRVRETRRSTQGVTLDEIKSAEELVKKNNMNNNNNTNVSNIFVFFFVVEYNIQIVPEKCVPVWKMYTPLKWVLFFVVYFTNFLIFFLVTPNYYHGKESKRNYKIVLWLSIFCFVLFDFLTIKKKMEIMNTQTNHIHHYYYCYYTLVMNLWRNY